MATKITKQNVFITAERVPLLLSDLKQKYPETTRLDYESSAHNLQISLFGLGWHTRVTIDGAIFTIHQLNPKADDNMLELFNILSKYMDDRGIIVATKDDNTYTFTKNGCGNVIAEKEISSKDECLLKIEDDIEDSLIEDVIDTNETEVLTPIFYKTKDEEIKSESVIDSNVVKKNKGGRPRKST